MDKKLLNTKSFAFTVVAAIAFFALAAVSIASLSFEMYETFFGDPRKWKGIAGFMSFNKYAVPAVFLVLIAIFALVAKRTKPLGVAISVYAGLEVLFGAYDIISNTAYHTSDRFGEILLVIAECLLAAGAAVALLAVISLAGIEKSKYRYGLVAIPGVIYIISAVVFIILNNIKYSGYVIPQRIIVFFVLTTVFSVIAYTSLALSFATKTACEAVSDAKDTEAEEAKEETLV